MLINDPEVKAELSRLHLVYEKALIENDVPVLESLFWDSEHALRFGVTENLHGAAEIQAFRRTRPAINLDREVTRLDILALGSDAGIINLEFKRPMNGVERHGRQTQFWKRFPEGWKIVSAHVSLLPSRDTYMDAAAAAIGLPIPPDCRSAVQGDLEQIGAIARMLMAFPLEQSVEAAPVFLP